MVGKKRIGGNRHMKKIGLCGKSYQFKDETGVYTRNCIRPIDHTGKCK